MKVFIRDEVNVDYPVDLSKLSARDKIQAAIISRIHGTDSYKRRLLEYEEEKKKKQTASDMLIRDLVNASVQKEIYNNETLKKYNDTCSEITVAISSEYIDSMERLIEMNAFPTYIISRVPEDRDMRQCFTNLPAFYSIKLHVIEEGDSDEEV